MNAGRLLALGTMALVALYFVLRAIASRCSGTACDAYIPVSLLVPILILLAVAATGVAGMRRARHRQAWFAVILASTVLGVVGPLVALAVFRDSPDTLVPVATGLELIVPVVVLAYSALPDRVSR